MNDPAYLDGRLGGLLTLGFAGAGTLNGRFLWMSVGVGRRQRERRARCYFLRWL